MYASGCPDSIVKTCPDFQLSQFEKSSNASELVYSYEGLHMAFGFKTKESTERWEAAIKESDSGDSFFKDKVSYFYFIMYGLIYILVGLG